MEGIRIAGECQETTSLRRMGAVAEIGTHCKHTNRPRNPASYDWIGPLSKLRPPKALGVVS